MRKILKFRHLAAGLACWPAYAPSPQAQTIAIETNQNLIFASVRVNGSQPVWFCLDSGASSSIVDKEAADRLGLEVSGHTAGHGAGHGTYDVRWSGPIAIEIGKTRFNCKRPAIIDLSGPAKSTGHPMDGILGYDFLQTHIVRVDYEQRLVTMFDPTDKLPEDLGRSVDIEFRGNLPTIPVRVQAKGLPPAVSHPIVDSGSSDAVDDDLFAKSTGPKRKITGGVGLGTTFSTFAGTWTTCSIAGVSLVGVPAVTGGNLVGGEVLHRFTVTFDYPHAKIWFRPNKMISDSFPSPR